MLFQIQTSKAKNIISLLSKNQQILEKAKEHISTITSTETVTSSKLHPYLVNLKIVATHRKELTSAAWTDLQEKMEGKASKGNVSELVRIAERRIVSAIGFRDSSIEDLIDQADQELNSLALMSKQ